MRVLRSGHHGHDVARLQQFLCSRRLFGGEIDARFGPQTVEAVTEYQRRHNLAPSGAVDAATLAAMIAEGLDLVHDSEAEWPEPPDHLKPAQRMEDRMRRFGRFGWRVKGLGPEVELLDDWAERHIVAVECPVFHRTISLHKAVAEDYVTWMETVRSRGLEALLLTFDGAYEARLQRGTDSRLSAHAHGIAVRLNGAYNALGCTPAYRGQPGSIREIVPIANRCNWFWGGHHRARRDGAHFEHV